ncbi:hypothetical protein RhiLY_13575 [Ceratobasidium sp. AG-Ba]|nr:hypothetical protein RhiLY_13575 [Ceratobasidium sp. AG-Ba]
MSHRSGARVDVIAAAWELDDCGAQGNAHNNDGDPGLSDALLADAPNSDSTASDDENECIKRAQTEHKPSFPSAESNESTNGSKIDVPPTVSEQPSDNKTSPSTIQHPVFPPRIEDPEPDSEFEGYSLDSKTIDRHGLNLPCKLYYSTFLEDAERRFGSADIEA